jgi:6-phosphogluconolactonase
MSRSWLLPSSRTVVRVKTLLLVGAYGPGEPGSPGGLVHVLEHDHDGALAARRDPVPLPAPSYLTPHPRLPVVYAVGETDPVGSVTALAVDDEGGLAPMGEGRELAGSGPCHAVAHPDGHFLLTAEYISGSVSVHRLLADGTVGDRTDHVRFEGHGPVTDRQEAPHAHQVTIDPRDHAVRVVDLGSDTVHRFALDESTGLLRPLEPRPQHPGNGPRHLADHPSGWTYVTNELASTVSRWDLDEPVPSTWRESGGPNLPSGVEASPDGRFLYVGNRGRDTIAVFAVEEDGRLSYRDETPVRGRWPRQFALHDRWVYVACQYSGTVTVLDRRDDRLSPTGVSAPAPGAACVLPLPLVPALRKDGV